MVYNVGSGAVFVMEIVRDGIWFARKVGVKPRSQQPKFRERPPFLGEFDAGRGISTRGPPPPTLRISSVSTVKAWRSLAKVVTSVKWWYKLDPSPFVRSLFGVSDGHVGELT